VKEEQTIIYSKQITGARLQGVEKLREGKSKKE